MVVLHSRLRQRTHGLIIGSEKDVASPLIRHLQNHLESFGCPLLVPFLVIQESANEMVCAINEGRETLTKIHFTIGMHEPEDARRLGGYQSETGSPDLNKITQRLTCLAQDFTELRCRTKLLCSLCLFASNWHSSCGSLCESKERMQPVCQRKFRLLNDRLLGFDCQLTCSAEETKSQVQTVSL